ncbi:3',5'-cyclic AMP phosphodiesterase CpdA [Thermocatellispora tengchongensis]|uniref:3',5'-cyclic AMP phosphodiesterase CpdA n=1 Tax=Thermocatellispora tengchongensis TaxID=1073253 RepID=A0A840PJQ3_9ACTN|nr:metallophosphoesterase [Thermocatellispora tengchongensis]MBB5139189.1 3',5'-cyclic AMP phosphodiesterase CpdA [Thermocatellispora tengchongensis]
MTDGDFGDWERGIRPDLTFVQLTDAHVRADGTLMHGVVDTAANLAAAVDMVEASGTPVSAFLLTGDLADDGAPEAYRRLRDIVEPAAARLGADVVYAMGNHDERAGFRAELLGEEPSAYECDMVTTIGGLRVIVLDSTEPGRHDGNLTDGQLDWLDGVLATPAPRGSILVCHHPPVPSPVPTVHLLRMRDADRLGAVLAGRDVRMVVTGHAHHAGCGALAGVPVWVGPALAYGVAAVPPLGRLRAGADAAFSRIDVFGEQIVATAVPLSRAGQVYDVDAADRLRMFRQVVGTW